MTREREEMRARSYLLGEAGDADVMEIEQEYFRRPDALDAVEAAEEALIEDQLEDRLTPRERDRFERHYLSAPHHRTRVDTIRRLTTAARAASPPRAVLPAQRTPGATGLGWSAIRPLALAAGLTLAVLGTVWIAERARTPGAGSGDATPTGPSTPSQPAPGRSSVTSPAAAPLYAWSVSPVSVRSAADNPALVIPAGTDVVDLRFEGEANDKPITRARVVLRTVAGDEVWQGPAAAAPPLPAGVIARVEVPAARLKADDYLITLFEIRPDGAESERNRYFLRVRSR